MAATYGFRHVRSNVRSNLYNSNKLKSYDTESEEEMTGRSAEDLIDGGANTTDEEDMLALGDLLSDELPEAPTRTAAPTVAPVLEEEDEFDSLLTDEEALSEVETTVQTFADISAMVSDSDEDEFTGLDVPASELPVAAPVAEPVAVPVAVVKAPAAVAKAPAAPVVQLSNEDLLDDLDELDETALPTASQVEDLEELEELEATAGTSSEEEEDPFEDTRGVKPAEKELTARQVAGRKAAQTRKENAEKFEATEIVETASPFAIKADEIAAQSSAKVSAEPEIKKQSKLTGIKGVLQEEAQKYTDVSERDVYFYRLGIAEGLKNGTNSHFVSEPL